MSWNLEAIATEVRRELARLGPAAGLGEVVKVWPEAVGAAIAANAWPARVTRDGTLHVATSSSAWAFELTQLEANVRTKLAARMDGEAPSCLRFAPGPLPEPGREVVPASKRTVPKASRGARAEAERLAAEIEDSALRQAVARARAASLAAGGRGPSDHSVW